MIWDAFGMFWVASGFSQVFSTSPPNLQLASMCVWVFSGSVVKAWLLAGHGWVGWQVKGMMEVMEVMG